MTAKAGIRLPDCPARPNCVFARPPPVIRTTAGRSTRSISFRANPVHLSSVDFGDPKTKTPFAQRYKDTLRDCRISGFHLMIALLRPSDEGKRFIEAHLKDYERTPEVMSFMQLRGTLKRRALRPRGGRIREVQKLADAGGRKGPRRPPSTRPARNSARAEFDYKDVESAELADEFVRKHAPEQVDAKKKMG